MTKCIPLPEEKKEKKIVLVVVVVALFCLFFLPETTQQRERPSGPRERRRLRGRTWARSERTASGSASSSTAWLALRLFSFGGDEKKNKIQTKREKVSELSCCGRFPITSTCQRRRRRVVEATPSCFSFFFFFFFFLLARLHFSFFSPSSFFLLPRLLHDETVIIAKKRR